MSEILDSGERRTFKSGAVRDIVEGKGRCDLLPLDIVSNLLASEHPAISKILYCINRYFLDQDVSNLYDALNIFIAEYKQSDKISTILDVAKHYEAGCKKYGERNWEKGIPIHCYIDSGVRHLLKYARGDDDEPHDRAFVWNMLGALWTIQYKPSQVDFHV